MYTRNKNPLPYISCDENGERQILPNTSERKDSLTDFQRKLSGIVQKVLEDDHCYGVVSPILSCFGGALYEFNTKDGNDRFFLCIHMRNAEVFRGNIPPDKRVFERYIRYSNEGKDYLGWIDGEVHHGKIEWEGSGQAHSALNNIFGTWRANFMDRFEFLCYINAAVAQVRRGNEDDQR